MIDSLKEPTSASSGEQVGADLVFKRPGSCSLPIRSDFRAVAMDEIKDDVMDIESRAGKGGHLELLS